MKWKKRKKNHRKFNIENRQLKKNCNVYTHTHTHIPYMKWDEEKKTKDEARFGWAAKKKKEAEIKLTFAQYISKIEM